MLAARYNGSRPGAGVVTLFSVWNEPNQGEYLTPQFRGDRIVSPAEYVKLFMAAYTGIKAGDPNAVVAAGETSNRGLNKPIGGPCFGSVAPATFAELVAKADPKLPFVAWATHPDPTRFKLGPTQKVAFPNVGFSTMTEFGQSLRKWFGRRVPIWITEYGEMTRPQSFVGISYAQQAADATQGTRARRGEPLRRDVRLVRLPRQHGPDLVQRPRAVERQEEARLRARSPRPPPASSGQSQTIAPGRPVQRHARGAVHRLARRRRIAARPHLRDDGGHLDRRQSGSRR